MRIFGGILTCTAIFWLLGTAGSCDINAISFEQATVQCVLGVIAMLVGFGIIYATE